MTKQYLYLRSVLGGSLVFNGGFYLVLIERAKDSFNNSGNPVNPLVDLLSTTGILYLICLALFFGVFLFIKKPLSVLGGCVALITTMYLNSVLTLSLIHI